MNARSALSTIQSARVCHALIFAITCTSAIVMIVTMVIYVSMFTRFIPVLGIWKEIALRIQSLKMTFFF
jgi:hypothetical protein